jgi:flagellar biogenesis protein FliO
VFTLRYLDVCLVLATAPFVLAGGLPLAGYLIGAGAWLLTRLGTDYVQARARRVTEVKLRAGLQVASMMGRVWLVALAIILARVAGGKDDGIMAAALVLAAFTVYFVMSFVTREGPLQGPTGTPGRTSPS